MGGFLDRVGKIASGVGGAAWAPFGLVKDLAVGAFTDDEEFDGFVGTVYGSITKRGGRMLSAMMGPEEGLGAAFGGLPEAVRSPIRTVTDPALEGLEYAGREFIREPLTAGVTAASLMQAGEGFDLGRGYEIAQTRSMGQAIALAVLTDDITDEAEVAEAMGTDWFQAISGTFDAAARLFLEVDSLASGGLSAARKAGAASRLTQGLAKVPGSKGLVEKGIFGRTIRTRKDVEAALVHPSLGIINKRIDDIRKEEGVFGAVDEAVPVAGTTPEAAAATGPAEVARRAQEKLDALDAEIDAMDAGRKDGGPGGPQMGRSKAELERIRQIARERKAAEEALQKATAAATPAAAPAAAVPDLATVSRTFGDLTSELPQNIKDDLGRYQLGADLETLRETRPRIVEHMANDPAYQAKLSRALDNMGLGDEVVVYRGGPARPGRQYTNVSLNKQTSQGFAEHGEVAATADELAAIDDEIRATKRITGREDADPSSPEYVAAKARREELLDQRLAIQDAAKQAASTAKTGAFVVPRSAIVGHGDPNTFELFVKVDEMRPLDEAAGATPPPGAVTPAAPLGKDPAAIDRAAARIRDLAFHDHRDGAIISRVLAEADDLTVAWGALMGHRPSMETLWKTRADLAGRISRISGDQARIASLKRMGFELPDEVKSIESNQMNVEIDQLYDAEAKLAYFDKANAAVRELPRISAGSERRARMVRSVFFQQNALAAPLRLAVNMRPRNMVDLHDAAGDAQVARLLRKARLPVEMQDELRGRYMAAPDPTARNAVLAEAEAASIRSIAARRGITDPKEIDRLIETAATGRMHSMSKIAGSRKYDGAGRAYIEDIGDDGVVSKIYLPVSATQEFNHYLLPDLDAIDDILARHGEDISRVGAVKAGAGEAFEAYQRLWKPSVLLRVGWPLRVVGEEQVRIMSQIGALLTAGRTATAGARYMKDFGIDQINNATQAIRRVPKPERTYRGGLSKEEAIKRRSLRTGTMTIRGAEVESAWGTDETFADISRQMNSAGASMDAVVQTADDLRNGLRTEVMGEWQSLDPTAGGYGPAWEHAVNRQMGKDEMWRQFLEGKTLDEVRDWVENTAAGRAYLKRVPHWRNRIDDWLDIAEQTVNDYLPSPELRQLALDGKARTTHLEQAIPDAAGRPTVHGAVLNEIQGKTRYGAALTKLRDKAMRTLGTIPTDVLSRQPYFDHHYTSEVTRLIDLAADQGMDLTPEFIRGVEAKARSFALGESKKLLYDLADSSELSHTLRFISPFYSAWQEVITRWTGIAVDNPAFVSRLHEIWRAPEKMGIVTDENGATLNEDGTATNALGEKVEPGKDRYVNMKLLATDNVVGKALFNDLSKNIPGVKLVESAKFNKKSANLIVQGAPGVGPIIQIPVNEIAKARPELETSVKWALPFGTSQSTLDMVMPATARRMKTRAGGEEDRLYSNQLMRIYFDMQVDYNLNKRAEPPSYAEAKRKTDSFYNMRTVASFVSPVAPSFQSPYQPYIDAYRALKEKDPETADEKFLDEFGEEFFPLTQSLSKSVDGVPPTLEGAAAREKYAELVEKHPELGGLIIGAEGAGEFSSAVYQSQLQKKVAPGSTERQRKAFSFEEARAKPNERLGWQEYSKAMDIIDAERMNRGLPNLQVRAAQDLADLKRGVIASLEKKYPEWAEVFNVTDRGAWARKIGGLREIAQDDRLAGRPEIAQLRQYLAARDQVIDILAARKAAGGASTITAAGNVDLKGVWDRITGQMTTSPAFASLYYRYLERDPLELETRTA